MRTIAILSASLLLLALSACTTTHSGVVLQADDWKQTVNIDGELYRLTPRTKFYGPDGERIRLENVPTIGDPGAGVRRPDRAAVEFSAHQYQGRWYLNQLWVRPN